MSEHKTLAEHIVDRLCDGQSVKQIIGELGLTSSTLDRLFDQIQVDAGLPRDKRTYKARKGDIQINLAQWRAYRFRRDADHDAYRKSLVQFDF